MKGRGEWTALAALTVLAVSFAVFMEWLFFATKPSFLSALSARERLLALGGAAFPLLVAGLALAAVLGAWKSRAGRVVPALVLTASFLLLLDNFTRTLFHFGILSLRSWWRFAYTPVLAVLAVAAWRLVRDLEAALLRRPAWRKAAAGTALALTLLAAGAAVAGRGEAHGRSGATAGGTGSRPGILLLGSDGVNASHLSIYGYGRETTPFLATLARESIIFENAYSNAGNTGGSITSILTGRLPTETRLIYPPDVLHGDDAYRHLPGLLRQLGYRTAQLSVRHYADSVDLNLQDSFDWANFRAAGERDEVQERVSGQAGGYLLRQIAERLSSRLLHLLTPREQADPYQQVTDDRTANHGDGERMAALFRFLAVPDRRPFFVHVHLMGTHGATFEPRHRRFSQGQEQATGWLPDFYDDALLDFDEDVRQVVGFLQRRGMLEHTVLVIYSDHGMRYSTSVRVPLLIRLPGGARAGRVQAPAQNLDIAPTLLDALGVAPPPWMSGRSLLRPGLPACRPVLSAAAKTQVHLPNNLWVTVPSPPFYSLGRLSLLTGGRQLTLALPDGVLTESAAEGEPQACPPPSPAAARALLVDHLRRNGFDVSSLTR